MSLARTLRARWVRPLLAVFLLGCVALVGGCGGNDIVLYGTGVITVQSTNTEFVAYRVQVDSITMTRNDGIVVEPLLYPQTVDFTQLTDIGELLGSPAIPTGTYVSATITLDYTPPYAIYTQSGGNLLPMIVTNPDGTEPTAIPVTINFENPIVIGSQTSTRIAINVDLAAFNSVPPDSEKVIVLPYSMMSQAAVDQTPLRARGLYVTEMTVTNGFIMNARPFIDQVSAIGAETVNITPQTYWNVNGTIYTGAEGLAQLNTQQVSTPIIAFGTLGNLSGDTPTFNATSIYVGTMAQDPLAEDLTGVVSKRDGNVLAIRAGAFFDVYLENDGLLPTLWFDTSTVTIGPDTQVLEDGNAASSLTSDSIAVGQQVHIFGQATLNSTLTTLSLDATQGTVRIQPTTVWGTLNSATSTQASLNLLRIGLLGPAALTFAGTGSSPATDANPLEYLVNTGSTNVSATPAGTLLQAQGLVTPYQSAPPDFTASSITTGASSPQHLVAQWAGTLPKHVFDTLNTDEFVLNMADATLKLYTGPQAETLTKSPKITFPNQTGLRLGVGVPTDPDLLSTVTATTSLAVFIETVHSTESAPGGVTYLGWRFEAIGNYDEASNTFAATAVNLNYYYD
jgi:hypothetical protein